MIILPADYHGEKYGLFYRLVNEEDAEFIIKLRTDPKVNRFLHKTSTNVDEQKKWIRNYKIREAEGKEYYFIFYKDGKPIGLNRLYNIHDTTYTGGSWTMVTGLPVESILAVTMIMRELAFDELGMDIEDNYDGVHVDNKKVIKYNLMFGCKIYNRYCTENGEFVSMILKKTDFESKKTKLIKILSNE